MMRCGSCGAEATTAMGQFNHKAGCAVLYMTTLRVFTKEDAELVREAAMADRLEGERERCARIAERDLPEPTYFNSPANAVIARSQAIARAIRALK